MDSDGRSVLRPRRVFEATSRRIAPLKSYGDDLLRLTAGRFELILAADDEEALDALRVTAGRLELVSAADDEEELASLRLPDALLFIAS